MGVISWRGLEEGQVSGMIARIAITKKFLLPPRQTQNYLLVYLIVTLGEVAERSKATDC